MTTVNTINEWALSGREALSDLAAETYGGLIDELIHTDLIPVLQQVRQRVDEIGRDGRLSQVGKGAAIRLSGSLGLDRIEKAHALRRRKSDLDAAIQEYLETNISPEAQAVREASEFADASLRTAQNHVGRMTGIQWNNSHARTAAKETARPQMFEQGLDADDDTRLP